MERERQLEAKKPPRRGSLVDHTLIEEYYGPPSLKRKDSLSSKSESKTPTKTTPTKADEDTPIKDAGDDLRKTTPTSEPWADSESEEEQIEVHINHNIFIHVINLYVRQNGHLLL